MDSRIRGNDSFSSDMVSGAFISAHLLIGNRYFPDRDRLLYSILNAGAIAQAEQTRNPVSSRNRVSLFLDNFEAEVGVMPPE